MAGIAAGSGLNAAAATNASAAELQNNWLTQGQRQQQKQQLAACGANWICQGVVSVKWAATDLGQTAGGALGMIPVPASASGASIDIGTSTLAWPNVAKLLPTAEEAAIAAPVTAFIAGMTLGTTPGPEQECPPGGCGSLMTAAPSVGSGTYTPSSQPGVNNGPTITATPPPPQQPTGTQTPADQGVPQGLTTTSPGAAPVEGGGAIVTTPTVPAGPTVMNSDNLKSSVPPSILGTDGKLPQGIGGVGTPIPMPATEDPNAAAEQFSNAAFNGQTPVKVITNITGEGSWVAIMPDGTAITYRPAGQASTVRTATRRRWKSIVRLSEI